MEEIVGGRLGMERVKLRTGGGRERRDWRDEPRELSGVGSQLWGY